MIDRNGNYFSNKNFILEDALVEPVHEYSGLNRRILKNLRIESLFPDDPTLSVGVINYTENNGLIDVEVISTSSSDISQEISSSHLLSIVMPTHNTKKYIKETLKSISKQNYTPFELVIVDDGSTDGTVDAIKSFLSETHATLRAKFVSLPNFGSPSVIRNFALYNLISKDSIYITYMDDDDIYSCNDSLTKLVSPLINDSKYICTYGGFDFINDDGVLITGPSMLRRISNSWEWRESAMLSWPNIATRRTGVYHLQSLCVRTPSPTMPYYRTGSDAGYFARVIKRVSDSCSGNLSGIYHVPDIIFHYRKRRGSISTKKQKSHRKLNSAVTKANNEIIVPKFYIECGMPEEYYTQNNILEFEIRKRIPHIYNALYLFHIRDLINLIKDAKREIGISLPYLYSILIQELFSSSKIRDFVIFKLKRFIFVSNTPSKRH